MHRIYLDPDPLAPQRRPLPVPLLVPAIALVAGIALDARFDLGLPGGLALAALAGAFALAARLVGVPAWIPLALLFAAIGAVRHDLALRRWAPDHLSRLLSTQTTLASLRGRIADDPRVYTPGENDEFGAIPPRPKTRLTLDAECLVTAQGRWRPISGRVLVHVSAPLLPLEPGDQIEVFGNLFRVPPPANPGETDRRLTLQRSGILVELSAGSAEAVRLLQRPASTAPRRLLRAVRQRLSVLLLEPIGAAEDDPMDSALQAIILGQRSRVDRALNDAFARTGNAHLLAASGLHVGWLGLFVWLAARPLRLHYRAVAVLVMLAITGYALLAEPNPPILRAALVTDLGCIALWFRARLNFLNWLAAAALILLLLHPASLFNPGFQLSFVVVLAIVQLTPRVDTTITRFARWITRSDLPPDLERRPALQWPTYHDSPLRAGAWLVARFVRIALAVSIAAWLAGTPIAIYHFGLLSPCGWLNAALLSPLAFLVMVAGFTKLAAAVLLPSSVALTAPLLDGAAWLIDAAVRAISAVPYVALQLAPPGALWPAVCVALLIVWRFADRLPLHWTPPRRALAGLAAVAVAVAPFTPLASAQRNHRELRLWSLAVGDGAATVIELPSGQTLLYDCGTRSGYDAAARTVVPFLRWRGIHRIHAAFISHPDLDHLSALVGVAQAVPIDRLVLNEHFDSFAPPGRLARRCIERLAHLGVPIDRIAAPWTLPDADGVRVEALWPPPIPVFINNENNSSTVLRLSWHGRSILLTGDITQYAMDQLVEHGGLACDVLALPHHGSFAPGSTERFLAAADPRACIRSAAQPDALTSPALLDLMYGREYFNTADDGCICVTLTPDALRISTHRRRFTPR